ncbi:MAG: hypothetical protein JSS86_12915 [Cyanobacteria bacterium SZAS LIN-2]|nr:hypothetical protein [Cyanobacteria bacterium SZAS LIN-2]
MKNIFAAIQSVVLVVVFGFFFILLLPLFCISLQCWWAYTVPATSAMVLCFLMIAKLLYCKWAIRICNYRWSAYSLPVWIGIFGVGWYFTALILWGLFRPIG